MKPLRPKVKRTRKGYIVLESDIRDAMRVTRSNLSAAKYLGISYNTYKKWAEAYTDSDTGKTLLELHSAWDYETNTIKTYIPRGKSRNVNKGRHKQKLEDVLDGKYEKYPLNNLKDRLWNAGLKPNHCESCGFNHARVIDGKIPLLLSQKDGNRENYDIDNLEVLCYNCYYLISGNVFGRDKRMPKDWLKKLGKGYEGIRVDDEGYPTNLKDFDKVDIDPDKIDDDIVLPSGSPLSYKDIFEEVKKREVEQDQQEHYIKNKEKL
jgi:hypothetical protein|tara:strand:- start:1637 stop:2428 length:792 start_codon:yes stop_codon:yes gene_type:complete